MAYTIIKSDGTVLTTIADGTININSTSAGLPGRNYAGYGQALNTNMVHVIENYADSTVPSNPLRGQLWYNTNANTMYVCPSDGEINAANWLALTSTASGGATTFGSVTVTGDMQANNIVASNNVSAINGSFTNISATSNANIGTANVTSGIVGTLTTSVITTGGTTTAGTLTGAWTLNGTPTALNLNTGNIVISNVGNIYGIKTDNYMYANGAAFNPTGTYSNANVATYLPTYTGTLQPSGITTASIAGGGTISGVWTLTGIGSRLQATYADLAERFESDAEYEPGTVVEIGGSKEITAVKLDLSDSVFGVVSNTAAYLMNSTAGPDSTHPPVALNGTVLVNVVGSVKKGDRLVSAGSGKARAATLSECNQFNTIGRALADKTDTGAGTVKAFVTVK